MTTKTIKVNYLARVEGEGALTLRFAGKKAKEVQLRIFEPPRFFEAFLQGRSQMEVPDITARICGICPVAYQMSSCQAVEQALQMEIPESIRLLRYLLYCGEWLESHLLHMFMLHAPDFLGFEDAILMAKASPENAEWVKNGLRMKKTGNALVRLLGGREVHPINVRVGGFYKIPPFKEFESLLADLKWSLEKAKEAAHWISGFSFPDFSRDYEWVALHDPNEYAILGKRIISNKGIDIAISEFDQTFEEEHIEYSNALHAKIIARGAYHCGPLARVNLNFDQLCETAKKVAKEIGFSVPCNNPFQSILARSLEVIHAFQRAIEIIEAGEFPKKPFIETPKRKAVGFGASEAPRGILYHRYQLNDQGLIEEAKIIPPTSQNQKCIEEDLFDLAPTLAEMPHDKATWLAEQAIRNYDPCISCATHFLKLKIERE